MTIVVVRSAGVEVTVPVEASLVTRIRTLAEASDREAATRAVLRELSEVAANLAGSVDDATRLVVRGRVGWLKVPTKVTLHACLGTGTEGTFRELKPIQHTWDVTRTRDLAGERIASHGDPGDTVARVIARAIDEARRPHRL